MIVGRDFVYVRTPKTGSTFVAAMLAKLAAWRPELNIVDHYHLKHAGPGQASEAIGARQLVTNVRSPFDWYLSWHAFSYWKEHPEGRYRVARAKAKHPHFPDLSLDELIALNADWDCLVLDVPEPQRTALRCKLQEHRIGYLTWRSVRMMNADPAKAIEAVIGGASIVPPGLRFLRTENLNGDCAAWFADLGASQDLIEHVRTVGKIMPPRGGRGDSPGWQEALRADQVRRILDQERLYFGAFPEYLPKAAAPAGL